MNCENKLIPEVVKLTLSIRSTRSAQIQIPCNTGRVINKTDGGLHYRIARHYYVQLDN